MSGELQHSNGPVVAHAPPQRPSLLRRLLFPIGMTLATAGVFWLMIGHTLSHGEVEHLPPEPARQSSDPLAVAVTVAPVTFRPVQRAVEVVGTLYGFEEMSLHAKVEGRVKKILHDVSDRVTPGQAVIELDSVDTQLAVRQAEKNLLTELAKLGLEEPPTGKFDVAKLPIVMQAQVRVDNAKEKLDRGRELAARQVLTSEDLTERTAEYRTALAELANQQLIANAGLATIQMRQESLAISRQQLADTIIRAPSPSIPVPGMDQPEYAISKRSVSDGTFVRVGDEICRLIVDRTLKLRVAVPERYSSQIALQQQAEVSSSSLPGPMTGTVARINPAVDAKTRTFEVEILCENKDGALKPGGFAKARIITRLDQHAATVPIESLVTFAGISKIFLLETDTVREVHVTTGIQQTDWIEIARPEIPAGSIVVTSGQTVLAEGAKVFVRGKAAETAPPASVPAGEHP